MRLVLWLSCAAPLLVACGSSPPPLAKGPPRETVRAAAAEEFRCPVDRVGVRHAGHGRFLARGCGQIAAWVCSLPNGEGTGQCVTERSGIRRDVDVVTQR